MANRRMFSLDVVDTDKFLEMPVASQSLYFHLGMRADDDGFVSSPKKIVKIANCDEDDLKVLISKGFILPIDGGVIVIRHWKQNNYIQNDRKKETIYQDQLKMLVVRNGVYEMDTCCIQPVSEMETQYSIGKNSIDKVSVKEKKHFVPPTIEEVKQYCIDGSYNVDAQRFIDFYESKGWMVGKNKMKDWKAALRNWSRRNTEERGRESVENNGKKYNDRSKYGDL